MDNLQEIELKLWDYIDGTADFTEKTIIEKLIEENAVWRAKYHELLEVNSMINATELEQPSMRFTKNVMEEIAKLHIAPAAKNYINNKIIWGIAIFFITVIAGSLIYGFNQIDWTAGNSGKGVGGVDFTAIDYSQMFNNSFVNIFLMLNIVLGLMLMDRYLNEKRKKLINQQL